MLRVGLDWTE